MPRKKPLQPICQHYSKDLKKRVIYQSFVLHKSNENITIDLNMPLRVVQRVQQTWAEFGEVCRDRRHKGRPPLLSTQNTKFMLALIDQTPDIYLDEIQEYLYIQHDVDVSLATISRTLHRLGYGSKKVRSLRFRCADVRRDFIMAIGNEPVDRIVCADESAVNILTSYRRNGWSLKGLRSRKRCCFVRGTQ
ncbi:hypothetical protein GGX14DRAFT_378286 [Mycena pura]|uniref:Transposase Tc1-like domain-containing protein n=1 Tax=Mycena pura TaxID=153505 RepID=A0AAD6UT90_9AGAR|nr:hypothetical protein GGX14DRAFT_378286 [Mycena pura]